MTRRLAWVGLAVLSAYAVFIGGAWFGIYEPELRLLSMVAAAMVLAAWGYAWRRDARFRPRSVLLPAIAACLVSLGISTLFSRYPLISVEYLAYAFLLAALYLLLVSLLSIEFFRARFVVLATGLFVAITAAFLTLSISHWATWLSVLGVTTVPPLRPEFESLTFGNPSTVLTMVAMLAVPVVASNSWATRRGLVIVIAVLGLTAIVALVSGSRAGWLAIAVAGLVALLLAVANPGSRSSIRRVVAGRAGGRSGRIVVMVAGGALVVGLILIGPAIAGRVTQGGEGNRLTFVRIALELFSQSPLVGTGPGSWVIQRPALTLPDEVDEYIPHAHNVYAQTLGELGLVGALAGVVLLVALAWLLLDAIRDPDATRRRWGWATLIGLVYFAAHQLLDFYPNFPSVLLAAAIPVAYLDATSARTPWPSLIRRAEGIALRAAVPAVVVAVLALTAQEIPALASNAAVDRANVGDWASADEPARRAAADDPRISSYLFTAGLTAAHRGDHEAAAEFFQGVVGRDDLPEAWLNLAAEQAELGNEGDAIRSIQSALRIGRQRPAVSVPAADLAFRVGDRDLAIDAFSAAVVTTPSILGDPWWSVDLERAALRSDVVAAVMLATGPDVQWEVALMTGDVARARSIASNAGLDRSTIDFVDAWAGSEEAAARLTDRCRAEPLRIQLLLWCARMEGRRGNVDAANDYRYLANAQIGGAYRYGAELRVRADAAVGRSLEGNPAIFWGTYTYRRSTPWDVLVPSLLHLSIE